MRKESIADNFEFTRSKSKQSHVAVELLEQSRTSVVSERLAAMMHNLNLA